MTFCDVDYWHRSRMPVSPAVCLILYRNMHPRRVIVLVGRFYWFIAAVHPTIVVSLTCRQLYSVDCFLASIY